MCRATVLDGLSIIGFDLLIDTELGIMVLIGL